MLRVTDRVAIDEAELDFEYARSSGPGGQNVNKVETKVTVLFPVAATASLSDDQRARVCERLATRITKAGVLRVVSQRHRTRGANQQAAVERLVELLAGALAEEAPRTETRVPRRERRRRLESKRRKAQTKALRRPPSADD